jgi:hypothetical protein
VRSAGYSASALRSAGYSASDVRLAGYRASDVLSAGYSASALRSAGYSASDVRLAGYSASDVRSAGYSASALLLAGYSVSDVRSAGYSASDVQELFDRVPFVENPYTKLLKGIQARERIFKQSTFGPGIYIREENICNTAMCTGGHLVNLGGKPGWKLQEEFGFSTAGALIHQKAHPGWPCQNFGSIPDEWALAYIEEMAEHEANGTTPVGAIPVEAV